jgi:alanine racemase
MIYNMPMNKERRAAWVEINLSALIKNFETIRRVADGSAIVASVKADAYGHGAIACAKTLEFAGADYFGIATVDEAETLRNVGIKTPLVMYSAPPRGAVVDMIALGVTPAITTYEDARLFSEAAGNSANNTPMDIIVALDTGMGRIGFQNNENDVDEIIKIADLPNLRVSALASHFATSEEADTAYTLTQIANFKDFAARLASGGVRPNIKSIANSAALERFPEARMDAVRPGITLYGVSPSNKASWEAPALTPVMSVKANIVYIKKVPAGESISYGRRFTTSRESLIATLPLGYADGLPRNLTNRGGRVIIGGVLADIIGTVCMDQFMVDVTDIPNVREYDEAIVLGSAGDLSITATEIADKCGTIPYEILCRFGQQRLTRSYITD